MPISKKYPFSQTKKDYPKGSYIIVETINNERHSIEYDADVIVSILKNEDPIQCVSDLPEISKEQLQKLLYIITKNIVEISF